MCKWPASRSGLFASGTHRTGDWVEPRAGLDTLELRKFLPTATMTEMQQIQGLL